jgi:hypothetical protein
MAIQGQLHPHVNPKALCSTLNRVGPLAGPENEVARPDPSRLARREIYETFLSPLKSRETPRGNIHCFEGSEQYVKVAQQTAARNDRTSAPRGEAGSLD